ncbi:MAG: nuclear transport factor 2 family protein, partial [Rhodanobacteraceae bacterium]
EEALKRVEQALCDAFRTNDADAVARNIDETYTLTNSRAVVSTRAEDIAEVKKAETQYSEFRNHDQKMRLYGDTAVIIGITSIKGVSGGEPFELDVRFTDTYVRRADGWKLAAGHVTRIPAK